MRVWQEFYCGECDGYIDVKLNMALNYEVEVVCPNCGHKHRRCIVKGVIHEGGRYRTDSKEEIKPVKSAYHKEPKTVRMMNAKSYQRRDGVAASEPRDFINESWYERYGGRT